MSSHNATSLREDDDVGEQFDASVLLRPTPTVHLLDNGRLRSLLTAAGASRLEFGSRALTRWRPDATCQADGLFLYLKDLATGHLFSATAAPTGGLPADYAVCFAPGVAQYVRRDEAWQSVLEVCVAPTAHVELRRLTLTNLAAAPRRVAATSYCEWVLNEAAADAAHPAFSKLFVETQWLAEQGILIARRRPRAHTEPPLAAGHFLAGGRRAEDYESDRYRFLGRKRSIAGPAALADDGQLSRTVGPVLDPIAALQTVVELAADESVSITWAVAAGASVADVAAAAALFETPEAIEAAFVAARATGEQQLLDYQLTPADLPAIRCRAATRLYGFTWSAAAPGQNATDASPDDEQQASIDAYLQARGLAEPSLEPPAGKGRAIEVGPQPPARSASPNSPLPTVEDLQLDNGYGGFTSTGSEYVMRIRPGVEPSNLPPLPWANVCCNPDAGFIVTETGSGCTWVGNSRENLLTPWLNDPVLDPHSEAIYIRDEEDGTYWSPLPGPTPAGDVYEVRHGLGYTEFRCETHGMQHKAVQFVPVAGPLKLTRLTISNATDRTRRLQLFAYHAWQIGARSPEELRRITCRYLPDQKLLVAENKDRVIYADTVAVSALLTPGHQLPLATTTDRREFLGSLGDLASPLAVERGAPLTGTDGGGLDPCAAWQTTVELAPGESIEVAVALGQFDSTQDAAAALEPYREPGGIEQSLADVRQSWERRVSAVQIETPNPEIDRVVNHWLPYQNLSCRIWGRSSFYQGGGAYGFRDQLQDAAAYMYHWPELTREQIVRHASHQFVEGDVMHWWHTPDDRGIRTRFSDDLIWLPLLASEYVQTTGDASLWDVETPFLAACPVPPGEPEIFLQPTDAGESATVYEHCCRALDRSLTAGRHGLPLMGCGDWNDGMNRIGIGGQGESVWLGFFLDMALAGMTPVCQQRGDAERLAKYSEYREKLAAALNDAGWDGAWYRRAYFDDGEPVGSASSKECQIDALVQAWAVLSGVAPPERAQQAIAAVEERLVNPEAGIIHLLTPPFDKLEQDPGYIKGYLPGVRENGGQYTHGVLWFIRAVAQQGRGTKAVELLKMLSPITRSRTRAAADRYKTEPYVVAADVYGVAPHAGRGGWSWYTGSAGWMWRVAVESILGLGLVEGQQLRINPSISADWPQASIRYRLPESETVYAISIENPNGNEQGVSAAQVDGQECEVRDGAAFIPLQDDGQTHEVVVRL